MTNLKTSILDNIYDRNLLFPEILTSEEIDSLLLDTNLGSEQFSVKLGDEFIEVRVIGEKQYVNDKPIMIGTIYIKKGNIYCRVGIIKEDGATFANADICKLLKRRIEKLSSTLLLQKTRKIADSIESLSNILSLNLKDNLNSEYIVGAYEYLKANSSCEIIELNQSSIIHELENISRDYFHSQAYRKKAFNTCSITIVLIKFIYEIISDEPIEMKNVEYIPFEPIPSERLYSALLRYNLSSEQLSIKISDDYSLPVTIIGEKQYINNNPTMIGCVYISRDDTFLMVNTLPCSLYSEELEDILKRRLERLSAESILSRLKKLGEAKKLRQAKILDLINSIDKLFE